MKERTFTNAHMVTPTGVVAGSLCVRDGYICTVDKGSVAQGSTVIDCEGDYLIPGLVELHTDNLEKHLMPRPAVIWPSATAAFLAHDAQLAASGITTVFDSICIGETQDKGRYPMLKLAFEAFHQCRQSPDVRVEHRLHLRCELNDPNMWDMFEPLSDSPYLQLVSLMDHTPGQRQWRNTDAYRTYYSKNMVWTEEEFAQTVKVLQERQKIFAPLHTHKVMEFCKARAIPMASHDDTTVEHVEEALRSGISISEFPTTLEAARHAAENGMTVLMGSPNVVRGGSHSGNISALDVAKAGYLKGLSSDYVPASLLHAAFVLHVDADMPLHEAVALITSHPARAVGMDDRGALAHGLRADIVRVALRDGLPVVREVWQLGRRVF